jgi:hypothetical protein
VELSTREGEVLLSKFDSRAPAGGVTAQVQDGKRFAFLAIISYETTKLRLLPFAKMIGSYALSLIKKGDEWDHIPMSD